MKQFLYIANWKMYFTHNQTLNWLKKNHQELIDITQHNKLILCPSYESLAAVHTYAQNINIIVSAQDCSEYLPGAHTGQVSAQSLAEIGCTYCIVGHSEQRKYTDINMITQKIIRLFEQNIIPIYCINSPSKELLSPILITLEKYPQKSIIIAYEPDEAIGTGKTSTNKQIESIIDNINQELPKDEFSYSIIYGGSVSSSTIKQLKMIDFLDGFLIGKASTELKELKLIIES